MMAFAAETAIDGDVATVRLVGDLDLASAPRAEEAIRRLEDGERSPGRIVLDLRGVRFLDSTGLRLVLELDAAATQASQELQIIRGSAVVQRIFEVTQVSERLKFVDP
jgi:anti-sigma B factor antagonist